MPFKSLKQIYEIHIVFLVAGVISASSRAGSPKVQLSGSDAEGGPELIKIDVCWDAGKHFAGQFRRYSGVH